MTGIPQSSQLNPATQPKCGFFLGVPLISGYEINVGNSAVGFNDILIYQPKLDSMVWFMHDKDTRSNFLNKFSKNNNLFDSYRQDLFSLGFRVNNTYLSFGLSILGENRIVIPYDLARFMVEGNVNSTNELKSYDFSGLGANFMSYTELSFGISHEFNSKLTIGVKPKLLFGIANLTTKSSEVSMTGGSIDSYKLRSVIDINSSIPYLEVSTDPGGKVNNIDIKDVDSISFSEYKSKLLNTNNMGLAFDLGIIYKPIEKLSLSLSVLDLGYINWKDNLHNFTQDATYDFKGINILLQDSADMTGALMDTLKNNFTYNSAATAYKTNLSPKFYAGVLFQLTKGIGLGALTRQQIINNKLNSQYTFSLNLYPANAFNFTLSYTIADQMYDNFGFGMSFKLAFLQTYIMSERIPLYWNLVRFNEGGPKIPVPAYYKNFNFRFGFNIVLGYNHRAKKLKGDKPLLDL